MLGLSWSCDVFICFLWRLSGFLGSIPIACCLVRVSACLCASRRNQTETPRAFLVSLNKRISPSTPEGDIDTAKKRAHPHTCHMPTPTKRQPKAKTGGRLLGEVSFRILWTSLDVFGLGLPAGPPGRRCQRHKKPSPWPCSPPVKPTFW